MYPSEIRGPPKLVKSQEHRPYSHPFCCHFLSSFSAEILHVEIMSHRKPLSDTESQNFITVSTLLSLIDPVRGNPTAYSLDIDPNDPTQRYDHLQTRFLDSFALVCSTSKKGSDTASAVCMEQDRSGATVLRLARNRGVPPDLINRLRRILDKLMTISREGMLVHFNIRAFTDGY